MKDQANKAYKRLEWKTNPMLSILSFDIKNQEDVHHQVQGHKHIYI